MIRLLLLSWRRTELIPFYFVLSLAVACPGCGNSSGEARAVKHAQEAALREHDSSEATSILHQDADLKTIVDKVLRAHGGDRLAQWKAGYLKYRFGGAIAPVPGGELLVEDVYQFPDQLRREIRLQTRMGKTIDSTVFLNDGGQQQLFGQESARPPGPLEQMFGQDGVKPGPRLAQTERSLHNVFIFDVLLSIRQAPETKLTFKGQKYVHGQPALTMEIERRGLPVVTAYFDKATALLVKEDRPINGKEERENVIWETYYDDYEEQHGVPLPKQRTASIQGISEVRIEDTLLHAMPLGKLDRSIFQKPQAWKLWVALNSL